MILIPFFLRHGIGMRSKSKHLNQVVGLLPMQRKALKDGTYRYVSIRPCGVFYDARTSNNVYCIFRKDSDCSLLRHAKKIKGGGGRGF